MVSNSRKAVLPENRKPIFVF